MTQCRMLYCTNEVLHEGDCCAPCFDAMPAEKLSGELRCQDYEEPLEREGTDGAAIIIDTADPRGGGQDRWATEHDLDAVLGRLSTRHREALERRYLLGLCPRGQAASTGESEGTIKNRLHRAMKAVRFKEGKMTEELRQVRCADCAMATPERFRFADVEFTTGDGCRIPLCRWCLGARNSVAHAIRGEITPKQCQCTPECRLMFQPTSGAQKFAPEHRSPQATKAAADRAAKKVHVAPAKDLAPYAPQEPAVFAAPYAPSGPGEDLVTLRVSPSALDRLWAALSPERKARAIEVALL